MTLGKSFIYDRRDSIFLIGLYIGVILLTYLGQVVKNLSLALHLVWCLDGLSSFLLTFCCTGGGQTEPTLHPRDLLMPPFIALVTVVTLNVSAKISQPHSSQFASIMKGSGKEDRC